MRSLIDDIEELLALEKGDRYRLIDMRVRLEKNKRLYISDREFLENLVKTHLGRRGLSPDPDSLLASVRAGPATETSADTCTKCGSEISADEMFCTVCGAKREEPNTVATPDVPKPTTQPKLEEYEKETEKDAKAEGFSISADGEVGEQTTRDVAKIKPEPEAITKPETNLDTCTNCNFKMAVNEMFCINCGAKRETDSTLSAPKPIPQPKAKPETESKPKPKPKPKAKPKPKTAARKPTKKKAVHVKKSRKEELEEYEKKYLKKVETTAKKPKPTVAAEETSDSPEGEKHKLSLCVMCGGVISEGENFCTNCGSTR
ncbi:MAG: zinc ribbon domain-containing protein [SAR324 cluster bacterium]|nr:zinc ribbon domain-containing protein [SAR324 cluster bacterium]